MSTPHDGGNAFPNSYECEDGELITHHGMTLRDYLAAHETLNDVDVTTEMAELLAGEPMPKRSDSLAWLRWDAKWKAALRYIRADAMLEVRGAGAGASSEVERLKKAEEQAARLKAALDKILHHHSATVFNEAMDLRRIAQEALAAQARE